MKAVILAGGMGTRISEETHLRPKPMIEIGGTADPLAHHEDLSPLRHNGIHHLPRLQGYMIKEYFANYFLHNADVTVDLRRATR